MSWIQTFSGVAFDVLNPTPDMVREEDIAHALARVNRFTGHTKYALSVAEHSFNVALWCGRFGDDEESKARRLYALLHDASEAYICDVPRPIKPLLSGYAEIEARIQAVIMERFGCEPTEATRQAVKDADYRMLETERRQLLGPEPMPWATGDAEPYPLCISCMDAPEAERVFLFALREAMPASGVTTPTL